MNLKIHIAGFGYVEEAHDASIRFLCASSTDFDFYIPLDSSPHAHHINNSYRYVK